MALAALVRHSWELAVLGIGKELICVRICKFISFPYDANHV